MAEEVETRRGASDAFLNLIEAVRSKRRKTLEDERRRKEEEARAAEVERQRVECQRGALDFGRNIGQFGDFCRNWADNWERNIGAGNVPVADLRRHAAQMMPVLHNALHHAPMLAQAALRPVGSSVTVVSFWTSDTSIASNAVVELFPAARRVAITVPSSVGSATAAMDMGGGGGS
jgi:hypothetical protein